MKAIVTEKYGSPDILQLREVDPPEPKPNEVLVKVKAASVNRADLYVLKGEPFPVRIAAGLFKPKYKILGADIAGIVEEIGGSVTQLKLGDEVCGDLSGTGFGGFAEYATADERLLARKPATITFEESAALPMAAVTALQGLRNVGKIRSGMEVLINGASGGVGSYAIQIAKAFGGKVTAVCSTRKMKNALGLGADQVVDYTVQNFTKANKQYDLILDMIGNHSLNTISRVLKRKGTYVSASFSMAALLLGPWKSITEKKTMTNFLAKANQADLQFICRLVEEGKMKSVIERTFALNEVPEALHAIGKGSSFGKLVIVI